MLKVVQRLDSVSLVVLAVLTYLSIGLGFLFQKLVRTGAIIPGSIVSSVAAGIYGTLAILLPIVVTIRVVSLLFVGKRKKECLLALLLVSPFLLLLAGALGRALA